MIPVAVFVHANDYLKRLFFLTHEMSANAANGGGVQHAAIYLILANVSLWSLLSLKHEAGKAPTVKL